MSIAVMSEVWLYSQSKGGRLLVLLALADRANDDRICWPGVQELSRKSRLGERQVERVLKELHKDGEIEYPPNRPTKESPIRICILRQNVGSENPTPTTDDSDTGDGSSPTPVSGPYVEPSVDPSKRTTNARAGEIQEVWETYLEATGKRMQLNDKRTKHIDNALNVAQADDQAGRLEKVKLAVIGLSVSPHHNGENDTKTPYLDIRYALRGIRDESDDERIERMAALGAQHGMSSKGVGVDPARIERRLEEVRAYHSSEGGFEPTRAKRAREQLEEWGFELTILPAAPWVTLKRKAGVKAEPDRPADQPPDLV